MRPSGVAQSSPRLSILLRTHGRNVRLSRLNDSIESVDPRTVSTRSERSPLEMVRSFTCLFRVAQAVVQSPLRCGRFHEYQRRSRDKSGGTVSVRG